MGLGTSRISCAIWSSIGRIKCAPDLTYVPIGHGFLYLVAIIDWASRAVLAWRVSNTMDTSLLRVCARRGLGTLRPA
jgi:transposase InsO family protein